MLSMLSMAEYNMNVIVSIVGFTFHISSKTNFKYCNEVGTRNEVGIISRTRAHFDWLSHNGMFI